MAVKIAGHEVKTPYLVAAGAVIVILVGYAIVKRRQDAAAAAASPAAADIDPATGDIAGSAQDEADLAAQAGGDSAGTPGYGGYGDYAGGSDLYPDTIAASGPDAIDPNTGVPYAEEAGWVYNSQSGTWSYNGTGAGPGTGTGAGTYTTNAQWLQAAESYFVSNGLVSDGGVALTSALGKYLAGSDVTPDQETLVQQATGLEGYPPVPGSAGYPPGIHTSASQSTPPASSSVKVPKVTGLEQEAAFGRLVAAGLHASGPPAVPGKVHTVTKQDPAAGASAPKGSTVQLTSKLS
jgi:hypothetical protein